MLCRVIPGAIYDDEGVVEDGGSPRMRHVESLISFTTTFVALMALRWLLTL